MSNTKRLYRKMISAIIVLSLSFIHSLPSEKALAGASVGNDTNTLQNATDALTEATRALQNAVQRLGQNNSESVNDNLTLSIETSREKYAIGGPIHIFGNLTTTNGTMANDTIKISISLR
jgi:hypothetical protein